MQYLKEYRRNVYLDLMMSGRLNSYLADIEEQAQERFERIVEQMKQAQGITERLKADNAWEWVGRMNNICLLYTSPAVWILPLQQVCYPVQSENSLPVCS